MSDTNIKSGINKSLEKIKERTHRSSLTVAFSLFVFLILITALGLGTLAMYILAETGVIGEELEIGTVLLFSFLSSLIIGAGLVFLSMKLPLKPINILINNMNRLAAGDFGARLDFGPTLSTHPAFAEITESFNAMAEELENTETLRSDFVNNISHEFKTPIVSISGLARHLQRRGIDEEERRTYLAAIEEESRRLAALSTNILNLARVESKSILTDRTEFNLSEQIRSAVLLLEEEWTEKEIELSLDFDEYEIFANEELLKQVWINLIDNAVKFADYQGSVGVGIAREGEMLSVRISNTGTEIPSDKLDKIFGRFYRIDESHSKEGNGIGLAIVKKIVALHSGEVYATSENGVTTLCVVLPANI